MVNQPPLFKRQAAGRSSSLLQWRAIDPGDGRQNIATAVSTGLCPGVSVSVRCSRGEDQHHAAGTRLNSSHRCISYAVFCLKKKKKKNKNTKKKKKTHHSRKEQRLAIQR